jgi:mercuric ion binding protein
MKRIITALLLLSGIGVGIAHAVEPIQTIKAEVNGMVCAFCAQGIDKKLRALPQTKEVYVNLKRKIVAVELKEGQSLPESTVKGVVKDAGYDVINIQTVDLTVQQVKDAVGKE